MATDHRVYDKRNYPIVDVRDGYGAWVRTYEQTVQDGMDLYLLDRVRAVDWSSARSVLDLACGTGRIGEWIRRRTGAPIDGVDLTPAMLDVARGKGVYRALHVGDVNATGLPAETYDLCIQSLADEHLPELAPLYREVTRVTRPNAWFVLVGFHPQFMMAGIPTHFDRSPGDPVSIRSYVHLLSDHVKAARALGWSLLEMDERLVDDAWLEVKPKWKDHVGLPLSFLMAWQRKE